MQVLLIDNDQSSSGWMARRLDEAGFRPLVAISVEDALARGQASASSAIIVETGANTPDAVQVVRRIRSSGFDRPVLFVANENDWRERVAALDAGADDFMVKPMRSEEIAARLRVAMRRAMGAATERLQIGRFTLDLGAQCAWLDGRCLTLTRNEFTLLRLLLLNPGKVVSPAQIRDEFGPRRAAISINAIEVQIARLRKKIGPGPIRTVRSLGYRYVAELGEQQVPDAQLESCKSGNQTIFVEGRYSADDAALAI